MYLIRDVLDKPLVGRGEDPAGRVDGLIVELRDGHPPRVIAIECGFAVLARRLHPRFESLVRIIGRRFSPRRGRPYRISWRRVKKIDVEIELDLDANRSPATRWERWLLSHFTRFIPTMHK